MNGNLEILNHWSYCLFSLKSSCHQKVRIEIVVSPQNLIDFSCRFLFNVGKKLFHRANSVHMVSKWKLPIVPDSRIFLLTSVANYNSSEIPKFSRRELERLIISLRPSIESDFKESSGGIFIYNITNSPIALVVFSIDKIIDLVDFPELFWLLDLLFGLFRCWHCFKI